MYNIIYTSFSIYYVACVRKIDMRDWALLGTSPITDYYYFEVLYE